MTIIMTLKIKQSRSSAIAEKLRDTRYYLEMLSRIKTTGALRGAYQPPNGWFQSHNTCIYVCALFVGGR